MVKPDEHKRKTIKVEVCVPSAVESKYFKWHKRTKVGDAADEVARAFGLSVEEATFQTCNDDVLDRSKTLAEEGIEDGDKLELVSAGGGV